MSFSSSRHFPPDRRVGPGFRMSYARRVADGFMQRYFAGERVLDIGYKGGDPDSVPVTDWAVGITLEYPGYDGTTLPFDDMSQDTVLASHILEHVDNFKEVLWEWHRVLKVGGFLVLLVPHQYLFEKRPTLPSIRTGDHRRFYTAAKLLAEIDESLPINGFRIRHLMENDAGYNYSAPFDSHPANLCEIELVIERIERPPYSDALVYPPGVERMLQCIDAFIIEAVRELAAGRPADEMLRGIIGQTRYFTPWWRLWQTLRNAGLTMDEARKAVRPLLDLVRIDAAEYVSLNPDLVINDDPPAHWRNLGYFEGRPAQDLGMLAYNQYHAS